MSQEATDTTAPGADAPLPVEGYYRWQSMIYDATRWSFLFGRDAILRDTAAAGPAPERVLEVGCGTGRNLRKMAALFPGARLTGLDVSADMLELAGRKTAGLGGRVDLARRRYEEPLAEGSFDLVLFSYALSMFNPGWEAAIDTAVKDLRPGGLLAVVDFDDSPFPLFRRWMAFNHVRMEGHLLPHLQRAVEPLSTRRLPAYAGLWRHLRFTGRRR
jgi:S-adenosylmethionine-diacylgycerolhomoserine-N-methlytransferase